jgi:hypothetical protein
MTMLSVNRLQGFRDKNHARLVRRSKKVLFDLFKKVLRDKRVAYIGWTQGFDDRGRFFNSPLSVGLYEHVSESNWDSRIRIFFEFIEGYNHSQRYTKYLENLIYFFNSFPEVTESLFQENSMRVCLFKGRLVIEYLSLVSHGNTLNSVWETWTI